MFLTYGNLIITDENSSYLTMPDELGGSLYFSGNTSSSLSLLNDIDFRLGSGDFTIEWFQYMLDGSGSTTRLFQMGTWPNATIGVSIEGGSSNRSFYYWQGGSIAFSSSIVGANIHGKWVHFAIVRNSGLLKVYMNGSQLGSSVSSSYNHTDSTNVLRIGQESTLSYPSSSYKGYITNFRWIKGSAIYLGDFSIPTKPLTAISNTKLLILATDEQTKSNDSSGLGKTIVNSNVDWDILKPFS